MRSKYDVFISYTRNDTTFVRKLTEHLINKGFTVFYDEASIAVGDSLAESLFQAIENAKFVLIIMSPDYFKSTWTTKELEIALNQEFESKKTKVLPLLYRDCEIPPLLNAKVYADFRTEGDFERSFRLIEYALSNRPVDNVRSVEGQKGSSKSLGSISKATFDSDELKGMLNDLKIKVEAFIDKSDPHTSISVKPTIEIDPELCFIIMPFGSDELNDVYEYFMKPSLENNCKLRCQRGDDVFGSNVVMEDIRKSIERARIIIADLTGRNPNVFYEVGIAHTLNKDVLLLCQTMSDVPFDLRHRRVLVYEYSPKGCRKLESKIVENVNSILRP